MAEEIKKERKKRSLSLIQPTSVPTLGNYLGAMRGWKDSKMILIQCSALPICTQLP